LIRKKYPNQGIESPWTRLDEIVIERARNTEAFWTQAEQELQHSDLLKHPFYRAWSLGRLTRQEISFYGWQYLEHVAAFPTYLTALHSRLPEGEMRRAILLNAADEEVRGINHADLWRQFVFAIDVESPPITAVLPEMRQLVKTYRDFSREGAPAAALGAFYAYESQVPRLAEEKIAALKQFFAADEIVLEYFILHAKVDHEHAHVWRQLIDSLIAADARNGALALAGLTEGARALWHALDGIERGRIVLLDQ
jgi:pyrroloquinoline-quinone synthase